MDRGTTLIFETIWQGVNDVIVIVTRYFGGIHLGPDRFKCVSVLPSA